MTEDSPIARARAIHAQRMKEQAPQIAEENRAIHNIEPPWVPPADTSPVRTRCGCKHQLSRHVVPFNWFDGCKAELATIPSRRTLACDVPGCGCREFH